VFALYSADERETLGVELTLLAIAEPAMMLAY
jgi:hypothetical protein